MGDAEVTASSWRMVEVGRVVLFAAGPYAGRLAVIVQIVDHKRVLVDGPSDKEGAAVPRHAARLSGVSLTGIVMDKLPRGIGHGPLKKKWVEEDIENKWNSTAFAKNREKTIRRRQLSDFERFKAMRLRKQARFEVRKALAAAKASA